MPTPLFTHHPFLLRVSIMMRGVILTLAAIITAPAISSAQTTLMPYDYFQTSDTFNIKDQASRENIRYARELYLKGDFAGSAAVLRQVLLMDCANVQAKEDLKRIAGKGPQYSAISRWLATFTCPADKNKKGEGRPAACAVTIETKTAPIIEDPAKVLFVTANVLPPATDNTNPATLQDKFAAINARLNGIEENIAEKNKRLEMLHQTIQVSQP
jgi:hypothetical protein